MPGTGGISPRRVRSRPHGGCVRPERPMTGHRRQWAGGVTSVRTVRGYGFQVSGVQLQKAAPGRPVTRATGLPGPRRCRAGRRPECCDHRRPATARLVLLAGAPRASGFLIAVDRMSAHARRPEATRGRRRGGRCSAAGGVRSCRTGLVWRWVRTEPLAGPLALVAVISHLSAHSQVPGSGPTGVRTRRRVLQLP
jgi:hypothetical protein